MRRRFRPTILALTCALALHAVHATAQTPADTTKPASTTADSARPSADTTRKTLGELPIFITGYITTSYTYGFEHTGDRLVGRFYDRYHDQFMANALRLGIEKLAATDKLDAGARFELLFGQDAAVTKSLGLDLGPNSDLTEAYVTVNVPTGGPDYYLQFKAGKMWTQMGYEVIDDVLDPNLSVGNQFVYLENFTQTGLTAFLKVGPKWDFTAHVINGWDVVSDNNTSKSFMGRVGWTPSAAFSIGVLGYYGPEQAGSTENKRYGTNIVATVKPLSRTTVVGQFDYGKEEGLGAGGGDASWWGIGGWLLIDTGSKTQLAFRGDYVSDDDGVRSSGVLGYAVAPERKFGSATVTLNYHLVSKVILRPEFRYDFSNQEDYGDLNANESGFGTKKSQPSIGFGASYQF